MPSLEDFKKKGIDPTVAQIILLDELVGRTAEQGSKQFSFNRFKGPMTRMFKRVLVHQYATILAGTSGRIYFLKNPQPDLLVGIIKQVANSWYANTHLEWKIDHYPRRIEYVIGQTDAPKHYDEGIPFEYEVEWIAYNNSGQDYTFEVICDGYFIKRQDFDRIVD